MIVDLRFRMEEVAQHPQYGGRIVEYVKVLQMRKRTVVGDGYVELWVDVPTEDLA